jgi:hypothetical protein
MKEILFTKHLKENVILHARIKLFILDFLTLVCLVLGVV